MNFNLGQKVKVQHRFFHESNLKIIKGTVVYKNDHYITVRTKNYNTSINLVDFMINAAVLL